MILYHYQIPEISELSKDESGILFVFESGSLVKLKVLP